MKEYYLKQAQLLAKIAIKQKDPVLWDLAKCNLIKGLTFEKNN